MKKLLLSITISLISLATFGQEEYKAVNGKVYKIGDTIRLGKGSGQNGMFLFFRQATFADMGTPQAHTIRFTNAKMVLKKIKIVNQYGNDKVLFIVNPNRYNLYIDLAIESKEVIE